MQILVLPRIAGMFLIVCLLLLAGVSLAQAVEPSSISDGPELAVAPFVSQERAAAATATPVSPAFARTEQREPCTDFRAEKQPLFGDTHVHTALSQDASTQGTRLRPADAYRFAKGDRVELQPYDDNGKGARSQQISKPLDFVAVTDHAELYGEVRVCNTPDIEGYDSWVCKVYRHFPRVAFYLMNSRATFIDSRWGFCGEDGKHCLEQAAVVWQETQAAAEQAYDRSSDCEFTSFVAYEWTSATGPTGNGNMHRNVIFRNEQVPPVPQSSLEGRKPEMLWAGLQADCINAGTGCDTLVIPHNSNLSGAQMMRPYLTDREPLTAEIAQLRADMEPIMELMQHKGSSECYPGAFGDVAADELCQFEFLDYANIANPTGGPGGPDNGYLREILRDGLRMDEKLGVNPFQFGVIASTDTHLAIPGAVEEDRFQGGGGAGKPARDEVPPGLPDNPGFNPGGLAVVWAEENSRDSIFNGMRTKETYGTSGPRIQLRFFGGDLSDEMCDDHDFVAMGYRNGVPMGGELTDAAAKAPRFAIAAQKGADGLDLTTVQIVKGWVDENGNSQERVVNVLENPGNAAVNPDTCAVSGRASSSMCATWQDPQFDPEQDSWYYTRVLEAPSCRWSQQMCVANKVQCDDPSTIGEGLEACCESNHRPLIQERAWSSPIWYKASAAK